MTNGFSWEMQKPIGFIRASEQDEKNMLQRQSISLEEDTDAPSELEVFSHKKLADRHNLLLKLKILLHQLVLCCVQSLRSSLL